jgi:hypothetical protein
VNDHGQHHAFYNQGPSGGDGVSPLDGDVQTCVDALRKLQSFNHLARDHLAVLESQEMGFGGL